MYYDHDQMAIIRAQLSDQLALLQITSFGNNPIPYFLRLEALRTMAQKQGFAAVADIAAMYEDALQRASDGRGTDILIASFNEALEGAIGCTQLSAAVAEAFLAPIAMRLRP